ncbi:unnamed protein product [Medioppia subpectinata]|uniref:Uncharacterized protein n=1 Tax=Medioppia subpectinata TaxID=1979941 RepID=A0A7R9PYK3_9ACAR|nr:unnamed protein product [Medioppia subpectinata]CAG2105502.1 unnamed protein product [Medioppia subpectinata]
MFLIYGSNNAMSIIATMAWIATRAQVIEDIENSRICNADKPYVDAIVFFDNHFFVIVDDKYYDYEFVANGFRYLSDGPQVRQLIDYDRKRDTTNAHDINMKIIEKGRYLAGFYQPFYDGQDCNNTVAVDSIPYFSEALNPVSRNVKRVSKRQVSTATTGQPALTTASNTSTTHGLVVSTQTVQRSTDAFTASGDTDSGTDSGTESGTESDGTNSRITTINKKKMNLKT